VEAVTVKLTEAESSPGVPIAVIVYAPDAILATVNVAVNVPPEIEQLESSTPLPDSEQA
jgi:hypothetical protein